MSKNGIIDLVLKIGLIILSILFWVLMATAILKSHQSEKMPDFSHEIPKADTLYLIEGNSLKATTTPYLPKPQILGILVNDILIKEAELLNDLWECEASYGHEGVWGDENMAYGAFQFWQSTWDTFCEGSRENFNDQVKCSRKIIFELGKGKQHWKNCWIKMNLDKYF